MRVPRQILAAGLLACLTLGAPPPGTADERTIRGALARVDPQRIISRISHLQGFGTRHSYHPKSAEAAQWIAEQFRSWGYEVELEPVPWLGQEWHNVIATRRGTKDPQKLWVLGTHYDSQAGERFAAEEVAPGADDNASGTAGVLEAAQILGSYSFGSTVRFITFAGEEQMLRGSLIHVQELRDQPELSVQGAIVLEMIGYTGPDQEAVPGCPEPPPEGGGDFLGVLANEESEALMTRYLDLAGRFVPDLEVIGCVNGLVARSDHFPFWLDGYPAIMLTDTANFRYPFYHTVEDTVDKLNPAFAARSVRTAMALLAEAAEIEAAPDAGLGAGTALGAAAGALALAWLRRRSRAGDGRRRAQETA